MLKRFRLIILVVVFLANTLLWSAEFEKGKNVIHPDKITDSIKIDGVLDEAVWQLQPIDRQFKTINPNYGDPLAQQTKVWVAYDRENLYFAFMSYDTEPRKIKTSIAQRDNIAMDDFVGILLDALGNKQTSYEFYVNPNGIQWDAITSAVSGPDQSPDFVWDSAGKITDRGYQVEIRIPLESIRYQGGKNVEMGVIFVRQISRLGTLGTWPELEPGQTDFNFMAKLKYRGLKGALKLEVLPNFTYDRDSVLIQPGVRQAETDTNMGVGLKYGLSSSMTLEATVNPDFSQVESDVFQVEVNRRYPIFFSEKRPFFMESKEVLDFGIIDQGMMLSPIHTRTIADPRWAAKFSGSAGHLNFALLAADDRAPGYTWSDGINPFQDKKAFFGILRAKYNIGSDNSIGILYSGRHFAGGANNVGGVDLKYRLSKDLRASLSYLHSSTREAEGLPANRGGGWNAMLQYNRPTFTALAAYERYDRDFFMATAFQNRTGIGRGFVQLGPRINTKIKALPWLKRIAPYVHYAKLHDLGTGMDDTARVLGLNLGFAPMGDITLEYRYEDEAWAGSLFTKKFVSGSGFLQVFKWLFLNGAVVHGDQIYYYSEAPFVGKGRTYDIGLTLSPGIKLKMGLNYLYSDFKDKVQGNKLYTVNIYNLHATYQFNKYFFLRGILRYDDFQEKLLTDLLASFTLIPGTVVHLGYGSLHMKNQWIEGRWMPGGNEFMPMKQGLFFKASYLLRIK